MKKLLLLVLMISTLGATAQDLKKIFKFATFYSAVNGGTSLSDVDVYSVTNGLETNTIKTPFDYSITGGVRKIARMGYEPKEAFKNGSTALVMGRSIIKGNIKNNISRNFKHVGIG